MAKAKEENGAAEGGGSSKKKGLFLIIGIVALIVLAGGGTAVYFLMAPSHEGEAEKTEAKAEETAPIYEKLETFTVNLADHESYLQVEVSLKLADAGMQEKIKLYMPEIRDALLRLLSGKTAEELSSPEGKEKLGSEIQAQVNEVLGVKKEGQGVKGVLFTSFIIQ